LIAPSITHSATRCSTFFLHQFDDGDPPETGSPPLAAPAPAMVHGLDLDRPSLCSLARPAQRTRAAASAALRLDTFEDRAWTRLTPFVANRPAVAATPPLPYYSTFPELNVRTYATLEEKPGISFSSLDAGSRLAVEGVRRIYRLPYFLAEMSAKHQRVGAIAYESKRIDRRGQDALFKGSYTPVGSPLVAKEGSLEQFLVECCCPAAWTKAEPCCGLRSTTLPGRSRRR
jgi:hypothetical protein